MAVFTLGGINFNPNQLFNFDSQQNLIKDKYGYSVTKYPEDLGSSYSGHYMVIHINAQRKSNYKFSASSDVPTIYENRINSGNLGVGGIIGDIGNFIDNLTGGAAGNYLEPILNNAGLLPVDNPSAFTVGFERTIYRTTDTIALYMPDTLNFQQNEIFTDLSLTEDNYKLMFGLTAGASAVDNMQAGKSYQETLKNLSPFMVNLLSQGLGNLGKVGFAAVTGMVQNPMLELIYYSPQFREFQFEFLFYPRSQSEALQVQNILDKLRFHQSPEIYKDSYGFFLIPPSEFDIKFYYNGVENENIPKISTCVLTSMSTDYAPNGFAAYEVANSSTPTKGGTGMPVGIRLTLNFKETEYITKEFYQSV